MNPYEALKNTRSQLEGVHVALLQKIQSVSRIKKTQLNHARTVLMKILHVSRVSRELNLAVLLW